MAAGPTAPQHLGRYRVVGRLGAGGMAEVLLASVDGPQGFQRPVVLKRILPHMAQESRLRDMFLDEARIAARIRHRNVVQVHELAEDQDELFMVMEYLEGETLGSIVRRLAARKRTLPFGLSAHVIAEVCAGLAAAHDLTDPGGRYSTVVHRDISPSNLLVTYQGEVKVIDFGIAFAEDRIAKTEPGVIKGKHSYMSPEQIRGEALDRRSDLFSLGTVLYELITGRSLFNRGATLATLKAVCSDPIPSPTKFAPSCPEALEKVCQKALHRQVDARFQSALEMRRDLVRIANAQAQDRDPTAWLRDVMTRLFSDRIEDKQRMVASIQDGLTPTKIPRPETDGDVVVRTVLETGSSAEPVQPLPTGSLRSLRPEEQDLKEPAEPSNRTLRLAFFSGLALLCVVSGVLAFVTGGGGSLPSTEIVTVRVRTSPPGGAVFFAGQARGKAPVMLSVAHGHDAIQIDVHGEAQRRASVRVVPNRDQDILVSLPEVEQIQRAEPVRAGGEPPAAPDPPDPPDAGLKTHDAGPPTTDRKPARRRRGRKRSTPYRRIDAWRTKP